MTNKILEISIEEGKNYLNKHNKFPTQMQWRKKYGFSYTSDSIRKLISWEDFKRLCGVITLHNIKNEEELLKYLLDNTKKIEDCWVWLGTIRSKNKEYGKVQYKNKQYSVHRLVWELVNKKQIPEGKIIRHICHNKSCINPEHLKIGSNGDNTNDSLKAGILGKLTEQDVIDILTDACNKKDELNNVWGAKTRFDKEWSKKLNVSQAAITGVRIGRTWKEIYNQYKEG